MSWKTIDFQGIISLDSPVVDLLGHYLEERENQLARGILEAIPAPANTEQPLPPLELTSLLKLDDAIDYFAKRDYLNNHGQHPRIALENWKKSVAEINTILWQYVEILEGSVTELFQQLEQISLEQWHSRLFQAVSSIKEILVHKMEDLIWSIKRLENLLWKSRLACENPKSNSLLFIRLSSIWTSVLDRSLIAHLNKSQEFLRAQYYKFTKRHKGYISLLDEVEKSLEKLAMYRVLSTLDSETRRQFIELYQLLKLWELNCTVKALPSREFVVALRNALSIDKATGLFRDYYNALRKTLFEKSLVFKRHSQELLVESPSRSYMQESLAGSEAEIHSLGATIAHYREFLLRADPDPYVRTRLGFPDRVVGSEPAQTKPLLNLGFDVEALNELYEQLIQALKKGTVLLPEEQGKLDQEIQQHLHEMAQPLATHRRIRSAAESILDRLQKLDELGSFDSNIVEYMGQLFAKLLRVDWKYNVLHGIPLFHQLYAIHQGLIGPIDDRYHMNRLSKFRKLLHQVEDWVKNRKSQAHFHDIELDINDIKGYLQDFLGYVQRMFNEPKLAKSQAEKLEQEVSRELLEYRYLFGNFFYQLRQNETEGLLIRKQFLFVDQYFETVEYKLYEFRQVDRAEEDAQSEPNEPNEPSEPSEPSE